MHLGRKRQVQAGFGAQMARITKHAWYNSCNSLAVQCPEALELWDHRADGSLTPENVTVQSDKFASLRNGKQWHAVVQMQQMQCA